MQSKIRKRARRGLGWSMSVQIWPCSSHGTVSVIRIVKSRAYPTSSPLRNVTCLLFPSAFPRITRTYIEHTQHRWSKVWCSSRAAALTRGRRRRRSVHHRFVCDQKHAREDTAGPWHAANPLTPKRSTPNPKPLARGFALAAIFCADSEDD